MQIDELLQSYFPANKIYYASTIKKFLKQHQTIKTELEKEYQSVAELFNNSLIKYCLAKINHIVLKHCKICGKTLSYDQTIKDCQYCSNKCKLTINPFSRDEVKEKIKQTNLVRYNVENPLQNKDILKKIQQTNLMRYGNICSVQNDKIQQDIQWENLKKFGVKYSILRSDVQEQIQHKRKLQTIQKQKQKLEKKKEHRKQVIKRLKVVLAEQQYDKSWNKILSWSDYVIPQFTRDKYTGYMNNQEYLWKCTKCGNIFSSKIYFTRHLSRTNTHLNKIPRCLHCYPLNETTLSSQLEKQLIQFCKQFYPNLEVHNRKLLKNLELDIVIFELKLAIQFNGCYWHSLEGHCKPGYHLYKTELCEKLGYRLIHIWEDDWLNNKIQIQQKLTKIFNHSEVLPIEEKLDRCWYSYTNLKNYSIEVLPIEIIKRQRYSCQNCGYLIYHLNENR